MDWFGRQVSPPAHGWVWHIDRIDIGNCKKVTGWPIALKVRDFQRRNFRTAVDGRITEGGNARIWVGAHVVVEQITLAPHHGSNRGRIAEITGANKAIGHNLTPGRDTRRIRRSKITCDKPDQFGAGVFIVAGPRSTEDWARQGILVIVGVEVEAHPDL